MEFFLFLLLGILIGCFSGFFGIGGGIILTPILLLLGFGPTVVIGTSLMLSLGTSVSGAVAHFQLKNIQWRFVIIINIFGIIGTQITYPVMLHLESKGYAEATISILYIILLSFFAYTLLSSRKIKLASKRKKSLILISFIGLGAGMISAALGVSGGFFIVPLLISLFGFKTAHAVGTSLASVVFIVTSGLISYSLTSPIDYLLGFSLIAGTFFGSPLGAKITLLFTEHSLKRLLGFLYITMIISVLAKVLSVEIIGLLVISCFTIIFFAITIYKLKLKSNKQ